MGLWQTLKDARKAKTARDFSQELAYNFYQSPICSDYENLFAQVRPLVNEMKVVFPYGIGKNGARLPINRTPEIAVLNDPNDDMGWAEFADAMFSTWLTENELDIRVHLKKNGNVEGFTILPPQSRQYLGYGKWQWQVMTTTGMEVLDDSTVMRLRFSRNPRNLEIGVSPASAARTWAQIDDLIGQYQKAYFENGAIPATITFITASTQEKYLQTRQELEGKLRGAKNRNKTIYAWRQFNNDTGESADQIEVKTIQGSNSTLAIKDIVTIINDRLNKSVGVSNFILGDDASAKYDNAELSDHQFVKRRVYPALVSFWNQFQHELERVIGGLGYGISFDLAIPELTERKRALAEINRINSEALVNLVSAGANGPAAVRALGLPKAWEPVAEGIYTQKLKGDLNAPISIDYTNAKPAEVTVDKRPTPDLKDEAPKKAQGGCEHSVDTLPPMSSDELRVFKILVELADEVKNDGPIDLDATISKMTEILEEVAKSGAVDGAEALRLLADEDVAGEIAGIISNGDIVLSKGLTERIHERADSLVRGYEGFTRAKVAEVLGSNEVMTAEELKAKLEEALPSSRAELIARNETNYAIRSGRLEEDQNLATRYNLSIKLIWRARHDGQTCDVCRAMDGKEIKLGDSFEGLTLDNGLSWEPDSWNDYGQIPNAHPNCRCYFDETLEDFRR